MIIGLPKEIKNHETRVALMPEAVGTLIEAGHQVWVQRGAGQSSGHPDKLYRQAGAKIINSARELFRRSQMIVKVKEPLPKEFPCLRPDLILFCYLHLAANRSLARVLKKKQVMALGFETLQDKTGKTPLLRPMSVIAGRLSAQLGARYLQSDAGGKGILLSSTDHSSPGKVLVVGGGNVGRAAAEVAAGLGARVLVLDRHPKRLRPWAKRYPNIHLQVSNKGALHRNMPKADLVIGAIYIPGARTPQIILKGMVKSMAADSVLVDVAVDQGGASETTRPTSIGRPTFRRYGVIHCAIANLPALAGRSASEALSRAILPYVRKVARVEFPENIIKDKQLKSAVNTFRGEVVHPRVRETLKL